MVAGHGWGGVLPERVPTTPAPAYGFTPFLIQGGEFFSHVCRYVLEWVRFEGGQGFGLGRHGAHDFPF